MSVWKTRKILVVIAVVVIYCPLWKGSLKSLTAFGWLVVETVNVIYGSFVGGWIQRWPLTYYGLFRDI